MFNQDLYNNIKKEPFKIPEDDGNDLMHTFFNPVKEGWLCKQGNGLEFASVCVCNFCSNPTVVLSKYVVNAATAVIVSLFRFELL